MLMLCLCYSISISIESNEVAEGSVKILDIWNEKYYGITHGGATIIMKYY